MNQINNDNTKLEETSTFKQTAISTLTTANDEVSSTLLPLREENDISALKYKDQLHNVTKEHEKGPKRILNEQQIPFYSTIDQLTKDLEQKNDESIAIITSMKSTQATDLSNIGDSIVKKVNQEFVE